MRVVIYAQTLAQLREGTVLDGKQKPDVVPVLPEACAKTGKADCDVATFVSDVERRLLSLCKG